MTEPNEGHYCFKLVRSETSTSGSREAETKAVWSRIESESISLSVREMPGGGLEVEGRPHLAAVEEVAGNRRINREDRGEIYLEADPVLANCPPRRARPTR